MDDRFALQGKWLLIFQAVLVEIDYDLDEILKEPFYTSILMDKNDPMVECTATSTELELDQSWKLVNDYLTPCLLNAIGHPYDKCRDHIASCLFRICSSHRKCVNAFLHVLIDQGLMAFAFVAIMMFVTGVVEGHWHNLAEEFERDYIDNIHRLWIAALVAIGPIQMMAFRFLSLKWRALAVSFLDVFEVTMMSYITHRNREELY